MEPAFERGGSQRTKRTPPNVLQVPADHDGPASSDSFVDLICGGHRRTQSVPPNPSRPQEGAGSQRKDFIKGPMLVRPRLR
jgi:hypothetical protein